MNVRKPDGGKTEEGSEGEDHAMEAVAEDMIRAFNMKDSKSLAQALRAAFDIYETAPHEEWDHEKDDSLVD